MVHCDVKSANVLLDRGVVGRIGDFGIARCLRGRVGGDTVGATHVQTAHVMGTQCYMPPEYLRDGQLSRKVDTTHLGWLSWRRSPPTRRAPTDFPTLVSMFEDCFDSVEALEEHLDRKVDWRPHANERVPVLHSIAERCLEYKHKRRPDLLDLLPELARVKRRSDLRRRGVRVGGGPGVPHMPAGGLGNQWLDNAEAVRACRVSGVWRRVDGVPEMPGACARML